MPPTARQLWSLRQGVKRPGPLAVVDRDALARLLEEYDRLQAQQVEERREEVGPSDNH
jgi:hypothetical protein